MKPEVLQAVAHAVSQERSLDVVLKGIVEGLAGEGGAALARVWLRRNPGELCERCLEHPGPPGKISRLHLIASAGRPISSAVRKEDWTRLDGELHWGIPRVAQIESDGTPILIKSVQDEQNCVDKPKWARSERIQSVAGYPLIFRDELLGVLGVFSRSVIDEAGLRWLGAFADTAAVAIANARAFDEIDKLRQRFESESAYLRQEVREVADGLILGKSAAMHRVLEQIEMVAPTDASVLILGETGAGKELVARAIHDNSSRRDRPLIKINCTAIPRELFESEFFGHNKGAFSGAVTDRIGRFQLADHGTLFLDEIGELPKDLQPKLLRVLQDGEFEPVGSDRTRHVNVRIIAATNRDIKSLVGPERLREDLYYRLSVFPIEVPPLRERRDDIAVLANHFLDAACRRFNRSDLRLTVSQLQQLRGHDWPGNVRELLNAVERAVIASRLGSLQLEIPGAKLESFGPATAPCESREESEVIPDKEMSRRARDNMVAALKRSGGKIYGPGGAAELLGIRPSTLNTRVKKLGLKVTR
ncbi:MAG: sigma 54-interacting transcriptional regulator [Candidatus Binatus sp.]